ncbi:putative fluoride ion transporter CrcB [Bacteroidia bacterium]|nr:putative fluoride ion transporter CrcB [Bacteroidia bacterium]
MVKLLTFVFIGGGLGSVARIGIARLFAQFLTQALPLATLSVNIIGSFLIGLFWALPSISEKNSWLHFLIIGFCGGFTTFSAFSWENFNLLKQGDTFLFFIYALLSISLCLLATWGGYSLGKNI